MYHATKKVKDDQTFHSYSLGKEELDCSIVSCSFSGDEEDYYCIGTKKRVFLFSWLMVEGLSSQIGNDITIMKSAV